MGVFLASHPNQRYAAFLRRGISYGFRIGFNPESNIRVASSNLQSVHCNETIVSQYLAKELAEGRLARAGALRGVHRSPIGVIPKPHQPCKFRLIVD